MTRMTTFAGFGLIAASLLSSPASAQLEYESEDGQFSTKLGGRIQLDAAWFDEDASTIDNDTEVRRARLAVKGTMYGDWGYKAQFDFADSDASPRDLYIEHKPSGIKLGNFNQPFSLEQLTSSNYITFLERGMTSTFATARRIGVSWSKFADNYTTVVSAYDREADGGSEGAGIGGRVTFLPYQANGSFVHLGAALAFEGPSNDQNDTARFRTRPEAHLGTRLIDTGSISNVDNVNRFGLEAAYVNNGFSLQSEYMTVDVERDSGFGDADFSAYYLYGSYLFGGNSRPYKKGAFDRVKPVNSNGAWEVGLRYSSMDLDDGGFLGGEEDNLTLGVNYYFNPNIRVMANLIKVDSERAGISDDPTIFQVRAQVTF